MDPVHTRSLPFGLFRRASPPVFAGSAVVVLGLVAFVLRDPSLTIRSTLFPCPAGASRDDRATSSTSWRSWRPCSA